MPLIRLVVVPHAPKTRGECVDGPRPCPFVHCRYHLASKALPGSRRLKVRVLARGEDTCALDVADRGAHTLDEIAQRLGLTRERVRQIEVRALLRLRGELDMRSGPFATAREAFFPDEPYAVDRTMGGDL